MSDCDRFLKRLDDYTVGRGEMDPALSAHLKTCSRCSQAFEKSEVLRRALVGYAGAIDRTVNGEIEELMLRRVSSALQDHPKAPGRGKPSQRGTQWRWMALAAMLLVSILTYRTWDASPEDETRQSFLAAVEAENTQQLISRYLDRSQYLLFSLLEGYEDCEDGLVEIGEDRELARSLLYEKRLLDTQLRVSGYEDVKRVCDELELVFLDLAASDRCVDREQLKFWQQMLDSRSTLMKLNLLRTEART